MLADLAKAALAAHGLTGALHHVGGDRWQLRALVGTQGAAAEIQGDPDETVLNDAAAQLKYALRA